MINSNSILQIGDDKKMTGADSYLQSLIVTNPLQKPVIRRAIHALNLPPGSRGFALQLAATGTHDPSQSAILILKILSGINDPKQQKKIKLQ